MIPPRWCASAKDEEFMLLRLGLCSITERAKRGSKMLDRSVTGSRCVSAMFAITVVLTASSIGFAQNGTQAPQKAKAPNKPFDAHDLSGFWDITNIGRPPGALNETSNNRPPMTPWGL